MEGAGEVCVVRLSVCAQIFACRCSRLSILCVFPQKYLYLHTAYFGTNPLGLPQLLLPQAPEILSNLVHFLSWLKYHPARYFTLRLLKIPKTLISTRHVDPRRHSSLATGSSSLVCAASAKGSQSLSNAVRSRRDGTRVLVARRRRYHQAIPTGAHAHACRFNILVMVAWEECTEAP